MADETSLRRAPIAPLRSDFRLHVHDDAQLAPILEATYGLLERTGVRFQSAKALDILAKAGADVHEASGIVRLPRSLVDEALALAPRSFVLGSRDGSSDLDLGVGPHLRHHRRQRHRGDRLAHRRCGGPSTKADLADITRMQDYLGSISFWWPTVSAGDYGRTAQLHELDAGWNNTTKHLMGMVQGETLAQHAVEMAAVVGGDGPRRAASEPVLSNLIGTVSPLVHDQDGIEAGLVFARAGMPVCYVTMPCLGTTAPASPAGALVVGAAEIVAAAVLHELAAPGAPVWGSIMHTFADPRTALAMTAPLDDRCRFLATELLHAFGLPALGPFGGTDAALTGTWQAGVEEGLQLLQAGPRRLRDVHRHRTHRHLPGVRPREPHPRRRPLPPGALRLSRLRPSTTRRWRSRRSTPWARAATSSRSRTPGATCAAGVVRAVTQELGADGRHYRDALEVARERAHDILQRYEPAPLGEDEQRELRTIVSAADEALRG